LGFTSEDTTKKKIMFIILNFFHILGFCIIVCCGSSG
jgi:hypothetical protein